MSTLRIEETRSHDGTSTVAGLSADRAVGSQEVNDARYEILYSAFTFAPSAFLQKNHHHAYRFTNDGRSL